MMRLLSVFLLLMVFEANATAQVNLVDNGGFEDYDVSNGYAHIASDCSSVGAPCIEDLTSWQPLATSPNEFLEIKDNFSNINAYEGSNYAELTPYENSGITQSFAAQAGLGSLSWWDHGRYDVNYEYQVLFNGASVFEGVTTDFNAWTNKQFEVNLIEGLNTLSFISLSSHDNTMGANIDAIAVSQTSFSESEQGVSVVPEADVYWLMLVGFAIFFFAQGRRF